MRCYWQLKCQSGEKLGVPALLGMELGSKENSQDREAVGF